MKRGGPRQKPKEYDALVKLQDVKPRPKGPISVKLGKLYARSLIIVDRELSELRKRSVSGKLNLVDSGELRCYVKLLGDVSKQQKEVKRAQKEEQEEELSKLTDEDFEKKIQEFLAKPKEKK